MTLIDLSSRSPVTPALVLIFCLACALTACRQETEIAPAEPVPLTLQFIEELVIGEDYDESSGDLIATPVLVQTGPEGTIYIADSQAQGVHVYDEDGRFRYFIGGGGEGPGEFQNILSMHIGTGNELITYDGGNRRFIRFSTNGEHLSTWMLDSPLSPTQFHQLDDERFLVLRKLRDIGEAEGSELYTAFFHLFDGTFLNRLESFGTYEELLGATSGFTEMYITTSNNGHFRLSGNGDLWFVPGLYDGLIYRFRERSDGWERLEPAEGHRLPDQPVNEESTEEGRFTIFVYAPRMESFSGKILSESMGLFALNDGRMAHLSVQIEEGVKKTFLELFNPDGTLLGTGKLDGLVFDGSDHNLPVGSFWMDHEERLYFIDRRGAPVIRAGRIEGL